RGRRLSRSTRRGESGARSVGSARLGDEPTRDQGPHRERSGRLRNDHRTPRAGRPPPPRHVCGDASDEGNEGVGGGNAAAEGAVTAVPGYWDTPTAVDG